MLETIRTHRRLMQFLLLLLILPAFAFFGVGDYFMSGDRNPPVAEVGGLKITQGELEYEQRRQMDEFRRRFGNQFDPAMFDTPQMRQRILENLVVQKTLAVEAARNNLTASDQLLAEIIRQQWAGANGQFDREAYKAFLAVQGLTAAQYEARLRQDLVQAQLVGAIEASEFAPKTIVNQVSDILTQQREVQELVLPVSGFSAKVQVTDEMLKDYYEKHGKEFETTEQLAAEYLLLDSAAVASQIAVSDADIQQYYEQNKQRFGDVEQRRASHILISTSNTDTKAAREKAEQLLQQLRQSPADFASLAKQHSQDPGSAAQGGDLGFFKREDMVKPFADAAFSLKQNEISDIVETEFGYHIIKLTEIRPERTKPLAEVKDEVMAEIRKQQVSRKISEMAETLTNTTYEQSDSLKPAADKLNLKVQTVAGLGRQPDPSLPPDAPYNHPKFLSALFSEDVLKGRNNTEVVEVAPNTMIVGRVKEYKPATKRPFEEVKNTVQEKVRQREAARLAREAGEAKLAELKAGKEQAADFGPAKKVSRDDFAGLRPAAVQEVLRADTGKLPQYLGVELPEGYGIYRINRVVRPENIDPNTIALAKQQVNGLRAAHEVDAYVEMLKKKNKAEILVKSPAANGNAAEN